MKKNRRESLPTAIYLFIQKGQAEQTISFGAQMPIIHVAYMKSLDIQSGQIIITFANHGGFLFEHS
jgi:hypothetical protein